MKSINFMLNKIYILTIILLLLLIPAGCESQGTNDNLEEVDLVNVSLEVLDEEMKDYLIKVSYVESDLLINEEILNISTSSHVDEVPLSNPGWDVDYIKLEDFKESQLVDINIEIASNKHLAQDPIIRKCSDGYLIALSRTIGDSQMISNDNVVKLIPIIYKIDFEGMIVWHKEYEPLINGGSVTSIFTYENGDFGYSVTAYPNINFGNMFYSAMGVELDGIATSARLVRCSMLGSPIWSKDFDDYCGNLFKYVFMNDQEHLVTVGEIVESPEPIYSSFGKPMDIDIIVMEIDDEGEKLKSEVFGGSYIDYLEGATYDQEHGVVITGWSNPLSFMDEANNKAGYELYKKSPFIVDNESEERKHYDYIALINNELELNWVWNTVNNERFNYDQITISEDHILIPGSERIYNQFTLSPSSHMTVQRSFWKKFNFEGELVHNHYVEDSLPGPEILCLTSNNRIILASGNMGTGWLYIFNSSGEEIDMKNLVYTPESITASDDGGFIIKSIRTVKSLPQPLYISSIWTDSEVLIERYNQDFNLAWRKTYDDYPDSIEIDLVYPLID